MSFENSEDLFEWSKKYLVGGVNSPARAYDPFPIFMKKAEGSKIYDVDGNEYIDYSLAFGPQILGHAHPEVKKKAKKALEEGWALGTATEAEAKLAKKIINRFSSIDRLRIVNTGTESTMSAIRLARGFTGKDKIIKFDGGYHGSHDSVLVKAGSGASTHGAPDSPGVPKDLAKHTIVVPWNNKEAVEEAFNKEGDNIAAIISEPIFGNTGCIPPKNDFIEFLREITKENNSILILDEVITGFRVSRGGAQELFDVEADLTTLGKIAGGGFPIGVFGGKEEIMSELSPEGDVYQAGTFSGNPLTVAGGLATLEVQENENVIKKANQKGKKLRKLLKEKTSEFESKVQGISSMFSLFLTEKDEVLNYSDVQKSDFKKYQKMHRELAKKGIYFPPSQYEVAFLSYKHSDEEIQKTVEKIKETLESL